MNIPGDLRYTAEHEWLRSESGSLVVVGITDFAQESMGDVVHVELPSAGQAVSAGDVVAEIETTKSVAEVYAPVAGTVTEVNGRIQERPELVNSDPYGEGWLFSMTPGDPFSVGVLLDASSYEHVAVECLED